MLDLDGKPITREEYEARWQPLVRAGGLMIVIDMRNQEARLVMDDSAPGKSDTVQ